MEDKSHIKSHELREPALKVPVAVLSQLFLIPPASLRFSRDPSKLATSERLYCFYYQCSTVPPLGENKNTLFFCLSSAVNVHALLSKHFCPGVVPACFNQVLCQCPSPRLAGEGAGAPPCPSPAVGPSEAGCARPLPSWREPL